eukprot:jgi/Mesen1/7473/ME000039S06694
MGVRGCHLPPASNVFRIGILSTYPSHAYSVGDYTVELYNSLVKLGYNSPAVEVIAIDGKRTPLAYASEVTVVIRREAEEDYEEAALYANRHLDVILCEHEFEFFGGQYGDFLFAFVHKLTIPIVYNLHTIPAPLTAQYIRHFEEILHTAAQVTVAMPSVCEDLQALGSQAPCTHIPHGVPTKPSKTLVRAKLADKMQGRRLLVSAGLASLNRGLECMLEALSEVVNVVPAALLVIVGSPEYPLAYAAELRTTVARLHLAEHVKIVEASPSQEEQLSLAEWLSLAEVVVAPYVDPDLVPPGVLPMAMGMGASVIATESRYAKHLCEHPATPGHSQDPAACVLVPSGSPGALAAAAVKLLTQRSRAAGVRKAAWRRTRDMAWPRVAAQRLVVLKRVHENDAVRVQVQRRVAAAAGGGNGDDKAAALTGWVQGLRQRVLSEGLALLRSSAVSTFRQDPRAPPAPRELTLEPLLEVLASPYPRKGLSQAYCAAIVQALSAGGLLFARWLPAPQKLHVIVDARGRFFCSNRLLVLHGDLSSGAVFHNKPEGGLVFGKGVLYTGAVVEFTHQGQRHRVPVQGNVTHWGHKVANDKVTFKLVKNIVLPDGTLVGQVTQTYGVWEGLQEVHFSMNFTIAPAIVGLGKVALVTAMDAMSKLHGGLVYDRLYTMGEDERLTTPSVRDPQAALFSRPGDDDMTLKWYALTNSFGDMGIFTVLVNATNFRSLDHQDYEEKEGRFNHVSGRYYYGDERLKGSFVIHERKWLVGTVQLDFIQDYDEIFYHDADYFGIDITTPKVLQKVLRGISIYHYHLPLEGREEKIVRQWLKLHGVTV